MKCWRARDRRTDPELGCIRENCPSVGQCVSECEVCAELRLNAASIREWCPGVVELECPSVGCADPRSVYPEVVSGCSAVWCPSVGCTDLRARSVSECREPDL